MKKKVSAILPVYNEENLLPHVLSNISSYMDEIVIIDGSERGPSTDNTKSILDKYGDQIKYVSGTYKTMDGAWDMTAQRNEGINKASGDIYVFLSADMLFKNLDDFRQLLDEDTQHSLFFVSTVEFWLDISRIRLYSGDDNSSSCASNILEVVAVDKRMKPYYDRYAMKINKIKSSDKMVVPHTFKFHLGWIRPFHEQINKHVGHVRQHRWGDEGEMLLRGNESDMTQWAIRHVLSYPKQPSIAYRGNFPDEMEPLKDMVYNEGYEVIMKEYESKHGSFFRSGGV
jgi:glycosyltransferase involved in cell wall biosynthesis